MYPAAGGCSPAGRFAAARPSGGTPRLFFLPTRPPSKPAPAPAGRPPTRIGHRQLRPVPRCWSQEPSVLCLPPLQALQLTLSEALRACDSQTSVYKCHCRDASTAVASGRSQMEATCHTLNCSWGKTQVNTLSDLECVGFVPSPGIKQLSLLFVCLFTTTHYRISLGANTTFCRQLDFQSFCLQKPVAQSMSCLGSESIKKLASFHFVLLKIGLTGKAASIVPRTKVCLSLESPLSVLNIINEAFLIIVSDAFAGCKPYA